MIKVIIVDDHPVVLRGLKQIIEDEPDMQVVGEAKNAINELVKEGLILSKPTSYGLQVSLNPKTIDKVSKIIEE